MFCSWILLHPPVPVVSPPGLLRLGYVEDQRVALQHPCSGQSCGWLPRVRQWYSRRHLRCKISQVATWGLENWCFFCQTKIVYCKNPWSIYLGDSTQQVMTWYCRATRANEWTFWTVCFQHVSFPSNLATGSNMFQHISNVCIQIVPPTERQLNDWAVTPSPRRHHIWWWVL